MKSLKDKGATHFPIMDGKCTKPTSMEVSVYQVSTRKLNSGMCKIARYIDNKT